MRRPSEPKELELAKTFLEALEAPFAPEEFKDEYRAELEAMIAKKAAQAGPAPVREPAPTATGRSWTSWRR
jgi:non-homologous end joining protein Ku